MQRITSYIYTFCGGAEIESSSKLTAVAWFLWFGWFLQFSSWFQYADFTTNAVQEGRHLCWPFFQSCGDWYFLSQFPLSNTHGALYGVLFLLLMYTGLQLWNRNTGTYLTLFVVFFLWELTVMLFAMRLALNFWYFHAFFVALFLFSRRKEQFLLVGLVMLYVLSGILKLNEGWIFGSYFTSLQEGVFGVPDVLIPLATNLVIVLELVAVWFLLSPHRYFRIPAVVAFTLFHTYSSLYVGYLYPGVTLPLLLILCTGDGVVCSWNDMKKSRRGLAILGVVILVHSVPYFIQGESRFTLEGNKYGVHMFEANYQCRSHATYTDELGMAKELSSESFFSNRRCDPYAHYFYLQQWCGKQPGSIPWTFDISVNGSPFYRIVDISSVCAVSYKPFSHNEWIQSVQDGSVRVVGMPEKNRYGVPGSSRIKTETKE